jgi:hypothetical protein
MQVLFLSSIRIYGKVQEVVDRVRQDGRLTMDIG